MESNNNNNEINNVEGEDGRGDNNEFIGGIDHCTKKTTININTDNIGGSSVERKGLDFKLLIRQMKFDEVEYAAKLFSYFDLNESINTLENYYEVDPGAFFVAIDQDQNDRVIGSCASPLTTHQTHFLGLYVVDKSYQGLGIGVKLFQKCLDYVQDKNCGLCAIPAKFKIYKERAGFSIEEGRSIVIIEGNPEFRKNLQKLNGVEKLSQTNHHLKLVHLKNFDYDESLFQKILKFDQKVHLDNRENLLRKMFQKSNQVTLAVVDLNQNNDVLGYGCIQLDVINRAMPGPLYAINDEIGEILMCELIKSNSIYYQNDHLAYFAMDNSDYSLKLAKDVLGLQEISRCEKLYTKFIPPFNYDYLYCCHTPDFSN